MILLRARFSPSANSRFFEAVNRFTGTLTPILMGMAASAVVLADLVYNGPLAWHFTQASMIEGGLEALALALMLAGCAWVGGRAWIMFALLSALYLRRHHVDVPALWGLLSLEIWIAWGAWMLGAQANEPVSWRLATRLAAGVAVWVLLMLGLHAAGWAHSEILLMLFLIAGTTTLVIRRRSEALGPAARWLAGLPRSERAAWALLIGWFIALLARSNNVVGFDSLWYTSRGSQVLAPGGSFFEPLGLVSAVHYFPKFWELILLPIDSLADFSYVAAIELVWMGASLVLVATLLRRLQIIGAALPLAVLAIATLPALASTALLMKTDVPSLFFFMLALTAATRYLDDYRPRYLLWIYAGLGLAACAKLTVLPYAAVLVITTIAIAVRHLRHHDLRRDIPADRRSLVMAGVASVIGGVILFRTWLLSGLPTIGPDPLVAVWQALGMSLKEPAGSLNWLSPQDWSDVPSLLFEMLFAPNELPKIRISWTGNVWLLCGLIGTLWHLKSRQHRRHVFNPPSQPGQQRDSVLLLLLAATGLIMLVVWRYHSRGADGNYFLVPVITSCIVLFAFAFRMAPDLAARRGICGLFAVAALFHAALGFATAGWSQPGTRPLDLSLVRSTFDTKAWRINRLHLANLDEASAVLAALPATTRTIGFGEGSLVHLLPGRVESAESVRFSRKEYTQSAAGFRRFLDVACITHIVHSPQSPGMSGDAMLLEVLPTIAHEVLLEGPDWWVYEFRPRDDCPILHQD